MLFSRTTSIVLVVIVVIVSLVSLILSLAVFRKCRRCIELEGIAATHGIRALKIISAVFIPINAICLLISGTYLIMIFWFMTTRYYNDYGFGGDYYPGGIFLAISPFVISLLGFFLCICAYAKSAGTMGKTTIPLLEAHKKQALPPVDSDLRKCSRCGCVQQSKDAIYCIQCGEKL